uniref:Uncharacterized protein n=1 Tax=Anopheles coluzzii TaxID=1518534 RepID=A0A8W7P7E1_ANOCL
MGSTGHPGLWVEFSDESPTSQDVWMLVVGLETPPRHVLLGDTRTTGEPANTDQKRQSKGVLLFRSQKSKGSRNRVTFSTRPAIVCNNRTPMRGGTDGSGHDLSAAGQLRRNSRQCIDVA